MSVRYPTSSIESRFVRFGLVAADDGSSRLVYAMVFALILIGVVLIVLAVVVFRRTRVDLDVLAPLERMGSRKWRKGDPEARRALLDAVRPAGATPPSPGEPDAAPVELPPPVIGSAVESPHEATFVAGPDGVEPVEHVQDPDVAPVAADESADAAVAPAEVVVVEDVSSEVIAVEEQAGFLDSFAAPDDAPAAPDVPVAASDDPVAPADDVDATPEGGVPAPEFAPGDEGASEDDVVDAPAVPEPVDRSVPGQ